MEHMAFIERVEQRLPKSPPSAFTFQSWKHAGRPTEEGFGLVPMPGLDPAQVVAAIMAVDDYVGNVEHVAQCRSVTDSRFVPPAAVRFYQQLNLPLLGKIQHELALHDVGERGGYHVVAWTVLRAETDALSTRDGFRSDYNHGAWFIAPGMIGYALGSAPKRGDVGFLKWKALTKGADVAASRVVKSTIEGMVAWAKKR